YHPSGRSAYGVETCEESMMTAHMESQDSLATDTTGRTGTPTCKLFADTTDAGKLAVGDHVALSQRTDGEPCGKEWEVLAVRIYRDFLPHMEADLG
ncbi:MAG: hypothetical protein SPL79_11705, partial [Sphaerochaetaceae bacterium]|nr:hypothetical protein [Sphaerochaetaceae bacterium]